MGWSGSKRAGSVADLCFVRKIDKCVKCESTSVIQRAMVVDKVSAAGAEQDFTVRVDADPSAFMFKKSARSVVHAWICGQCGYIELYAENPGELYQAFTTSQSTLTDLT
jgi:predicted nucleic-acid-binding Zn-ribbon protein